MNPTLSLHTWVSLPNEVRRRIRVAFNIPRSSNTVVNDGVVETDGTTNEDMKAMTTEKMQKFVSSDSTDFHKLFDLVLAKIEEDMNPKKEIPMQATPPMVVEAKKRGRPAKSK